MIVPMAKVEVVAQAPQVRIRPEDVRRGYVDVECASYLELRSNARCRLSFRPRASWFERVRIEGFPHMVTVGPDGGGFVRPLELQRRSTYQLSYRFELTRDALPGTYPWPLALSLGAD